MMIIDHGQPGGNAEQAPCAGEPALCPPTPWSAAPAAVPSTGDDHHDHVYMYTRMVMSSIIMMLTMM